MKEGVHAKLAGLVATRDHTVKMRTSALNKARGLLNKHGIKVGRRALGSGKGFAKAMGLHEWSRLERAELKALAAQVAFFTEQDKELKAEIAAAAKTFPGYENLISIKGIGEIGVAVLLSNVNIGNFAKSGHLAAFLGMTPGVSQSNDSLRFGRISKRGSKIARATLVQCALVARRYSPYLHDFHERIKSRRGRGQGEHRCCQEASQQGLLHAQKHFRINLNYHRRSVEYVQRFHNVFPDLIQCVVRRTNARALSGLPQLFDSINSTDTHGVGRVTRSIETSAKGETICPCIQIRREITRSDSTDGTQGYILW